eukprot:403348700
MITPTKREDKEVTMSQQFSQLSPDMESILKNRRMRKILRKTQQKTEKESNCEFDEEHEEELYKNRCTVCLEDIHFKAQPNECVHIFCQSCIQAWTKFSNLCPLCKSEIKILNLFDQKGDFQESIKIEKPQASEEQLQEWVQEFAESCYICCSGIDENLMLVCDECNFNVAHTYCLDLPEVPEEDWYCSQCAEQRQTAEQMRVKKLKMKKQLQKQKKSNKKVKYTKSQQRNKSEDRINLGSFDLTKHLKQNSELYGDDEEEDVTSFKFNTKMNLDQFSSQNKARFGFSKKIQYQDSQKCITSSIEEQSAGSYKHLKNIQNKQILNKQQRKQQIYSIDSSIDMSQPKRFKQTDYVLKRSDRSSCQQSINSSYIEDGSFQSNALICDDQENSIQTQASVFDFDDNNNKNFLLNLNYTNSNQTTSTTGTQNTQINSQNSTKVQEIIQKAPEKVPTPIQEKNNKRLIGNSNQIRRSKTKKNHKNN